MKNQKMRLIIGVVLGVVVLFLYRRDVWILPIYDLRRSGYTGSRLLHIDHLSGHCGLYLFYY